MPPSPPKSNKSGKSLSVPNSPTASSKRLLPWLVAVAFFMESLDTTILNTAVPAISEALKVAPLSMKSVLASYTLSLAVFIPISGWMADRFGTRRVFASAIGLFTLGSFLCGISSDIHLLVACRILQGCGGAMMVPVGRLTLVRTFAKSELIRAMSFVAIPALVGPMLGPIAGGLIVGYLHWRFIFFVNIPIGLIGLLMVYWHLPDYREKTHPLDIVGLILFGSGIALLSYVLEIFGEHELSTGEILGLLDSGVLLWGIHVVAIYQHEYARLCRRDRRRDKQRELHCEHNAANVHQLWCRGSGPRDSVFRAACAFQSGGNDSWRAQGIACAWRVHNSVHRHF